MADEPSTPLADADSDYILKLPNEILEIILKYLSPGPKDLLPIYDRACLSVESFASIPLLPPPPPPPATDDYWDLRPIDAFQLACKRFYRVGFERLHVRKVVRFSSASFQYVERIATTQGYVGLMDIRKVVRQVSYMVPRFYPSPARLKEILQDFSQNPPAQATQRANGRPHTQPQVDFIRSRLPHIIARSEEQSTLLAQQADRSALLTALRGFESLQQIRLIRNQDEIDADWDRFLRHHPTYAAEFRPIEWTRAYSRAMEAILFAVENSPSKKLDRFSSRFMDLQTPVQLPDPIQASLYGIAERLTCLDLQFRFDRVDERMLEFSPLFGTVFTATSSLQVLHVGFPRLASVPLESIFHNIRFEKLKHIGLGLWDLDTEEILVFLRRHPKLRSFRFSEVSLKNREENIGGWGTLLRYIRQRYSGLKWASLRRIRYSGQPFSIMGHGQGHIIWDEEEEEDDDDDDDDDDEEEEEEEEEEESSDEDTETVSSVSDEGGALGQPWNAADDSVSIQDEIDPQSDTEDFHADTAGDEVDEVAVGVGVGVEASPAVLEQPVDGLARCPCDNGYAWGQLNDNGISVDREQWKRWEKWVINRCSLHDPHRPFVWEVE